MEPSLYSAYQQARYVIIRNEIELTFKVDHHYPWLDELLADNKASNAVFITAYNPHSRILNDTINQANNGRLRQEIEAHEYRYILGYSTNESADWPKEASIFGF